MAWHQLPMKTRKHFGKSNHSPAILIGPTAEVILCISMIYPRVAPFLTFWYSNRLNGAFPSLLRFHLGNEGGLAITQPSRTAAKGIEWYLWESLCWNACRITLVGVCWGCRCDHDGNSWAQGFLGGMTRTFDTFSGPLPRNLLEVL